ncbi:hypothetical protein OEZ86_007330 [Tetradesmus obliquus]|nr:hypothetical protein OEZ86_007330 [Tetradesmus obliquus]
MNLNSVVTAAIALCLVLAAAQHCHAARPLSLPTTTHPNHPNHQQQQQHDQQQHDTQRRALQQFGGGGNIAGNIGPIVGAVAQGVNVGVDLAAPIVNGIASNVPVMVPSMNGLCMNGEPIAPFKQRPDIIMCLVGNGAQVTNAFFNAISRLGNAAGGVFGGYGYGR